MREWIESLLDLFYPPLCLHCTQPRTRNAPHFCIECLSLLELINPQERCSRCFSANFCARKQLCGACAKKSFDWLQLGAAFDHLGPAATLVQKMKYSRQPYLAKGAAAYLAIQFYALQWPLPDMIVPVPISIARHFERGYNQSLELAIALSTYLERPVQQVIKRQSGSFSQAGLTRKLRTELRESSFVLKKKARLQDKVILLIDDVMTTGSTLNCCAEVMLEQSPQAIYALTLCRAIQ